MFSEETDWCYRFRQAGWKVLFTPEAEFVHVGGATTTRNWGPMFREQLRGHTCGSWRSTAASVRPSGRGGCCSSSMRLRSVVFHGERRRTSKEAARWLSGSRVPELLEAPA